MTDQPTTDVTVTRRFKASAERVFDAWLDPKTAAAFFFATPTGEMVRCEIDGRVGGRFTMTDRRDGEDVEHTGEYLEIDRPRRLVFTFAVPKYDSGETRVEIDIRPLDEGCELTLTHRGVWQGYAERTEGGWIMILGALAAELGEVAFADVG